MQGIQMAVGFVDLERAYDTVPREMVMATVRWTVVPEAEARMVEAMYERTKGRVVVGSGLSEEFPFTVFQDDGTNQQEDQHEGCSQEDDVCRRSSHNSREQTRTTGSVEGMEWGVQEARSKDEPGEDRSDVGWTPERGVEHQVGCTLEE